MDKFQEITESFANPIKAAEMLHASSFLRCLIKAMDRAHQLLAQDAGLPDYDQIHSAKSSLYAAIERTGMKMERLSSTQRMLRELLLIVTSQYDSPGQDKKAGLQMLDEIKAYASEL